MAIAYPLDTALPSSTTEDRSERDAALAAQIAALPPDQRAMYESSDYMRGIVETTLSLEMDGMLVPSPERAALYGEDREREIEDLEAGRHPLVLRR